MEIGLFQLENLIVTQSRFQFLRLDDTQLSDAQVQKLVARATAVGQEGALAFLEKSKADKNFPVILCACDSELAKRTAQELEQSGYGNTYWLGL